jgi:hypothetical protein
MSSDNQFTALGPAVQGFYTDGSNIDYGVLVTGKTCGVCGSSAGATGRSGDPLPSPSPGTGVQGNGERLGVEGVSQVQSVVDLTSSQGGTGVNGRGGQVGVFGQSSKEYRPEYQPSQEHTGVFGVGTNVGVEGKSYGSGTAVQGVSQGTGAGVYGSSLQGNGVWGVSYNSNESGVYGQSEGGGAGVMGYSPHSRGVWGKSDDFIATVGDSTHGTGVWGASQTANGVHGQSSSANGVHGESQTGDGVYGQSSNANGVHGESPNGTGVYGHGVVGVSGSSDHAGFFGSVGVFGSSSAGVGVFGTSETGTGASGYSANSTGIYGQGKPAGRFQGDVEVTGTLTKGKVAFKIDHPLDPAHKYLCHASVEAPAMKNLYDGTCQLDAQGEAVVELPAWFEALNTAFCYQLTCLGGYAPVYIAQEIQDRRFTIAGGRPGMKVCWQVTGIRQDAYARAYPLSVEQEKSGQEQGHYLHPELYGASQEQHVYREARQAPTQGQRGG